MKKALTMSLLTLTTSLTGLAQDFKDNPEASLKNNPRSRSYFEAGINNVTQLRMLPISAGIVLPTVIGDYSCEARLGVQLNGNITPGVYAGLRTKPKTLIPDLQLMHQTIGDIQAYAGMG